MNPMTANGNKLEHGNKNKSVPDIIMSAADINTDTVRGLDVGMKEGIDDLLIDPADSGSTSLPQTQTQTQIDQDAVMMEKERIFMGEINRMITQYNAKNKWQHDAPMNCLPQKRPSSSLTVTHTRRKESTGMLQKDASSTIVNIDFKD